MTLNLISPNKHGLDAKLTWVHFFGLSRFGVMWSLFGVFFFAKIGVGGPKLICGGPLQMSRAPLKHNNRGRDFYFLFF